MQPIPNVYQKCHSDCHVSGSLDSLENEIKNSRMFWRERWLPKNTMPWYNFRIQWDTSSVQRQGLQGDPQSLSLLYLPGSLYQRSTRVRSGNDKLHPWYESLAWLVTLIGITLVIAQPGWQQSGPVRCLTGQIPPIQTWPIMSVILSAPSTPHTPPPHRTLFILTL